MKIGSKAAATTFLALTAAGAVAMLRMPVPLADFGSWLIWADSGMRLGLRAGYAANPDVYPPLTMTILTVAVRLGLWLGSTAEATIRVTLLLFLLATGAVFLRWTRSAVHTGALIAALSISAMGMAYTDILLGPFVVLAFQALQGGRIIRCSIWYSLACMVKWQPIIIAPVLLIHILEIRRLRDWREISCRKLLAAMVPALSIIGLAVAFMGFEVIRSLGRTRVLDPILSGNALNANWLFTWAIRATGAFGGLPGGRLRYIATDDPAFTLGPDIVFATIYLMVCVLYFRRNRSFEGLAVHCQMAFLVYFMFAPRAHENHLFLAVLLAAVWLAENARALPNFLTWAAAFNLNLLAFYDVTGRSVESRIVFGLDVTGLLALLLVLVFAIQFAGIVKADASAVASES